MSDQNASGVNYDALFRQFGTELRHEASSLIRSGTDDELAAVRRYAVSVNILLACLDGAEKVNLLRELHAQLTTKLAEADDRRRVTVRRRTRGERTT